MSTADTLLDIFAIACIPMLVAGALCIAGAVTQPMGRMRKNLLTTGMLFISASMLDVLLFYRATTLMVANEELVFFFLGLMMLLIISFPSVRSKIDQQKGKLFGWMCRVLLPVFGITTVVLTGWSFFGDFLKPRQYLDGALSEKLVKRGNYGISSYHLRFNGAHYETTAKVYETVTPWVHGQAEIGVGSHVIFAFAPIPFPAANQ
jgi:hypothetical protein